MNYSDQQNAIDLEAMENLVNTIQQRAKEKPTPLMQIIAEAAAETLQEAKAEKEQWLN